MRVPPGRRERSGAGRLLVRGRGHHGLRSWHARLQAPIKVRITHLRPTAEIEVEQFPEGWQLGDEWLADTTLGRIYFNDLLPESPVPGGHHGEEGRRPGKVPLGDIITDMVGKYPMITIAQTMDKMKDAGFYWATCSCVTITMSDVLTLPNKEEISDKYEAEARTIERKYWRQGSSPSRSVTTGSSSCGRTPPTSSAMLSSTFIRTTTRSP